MSELIKKQPMQSVQKTSSQDMFEVMEKAYKFSLIMAKSDIIPDHYRNKPENVFIAIQTAYRMDLDPMLVMQNTYVIKGKLGMNSSFAISLANSSGLFKGGIRFKDGGTGKDLAVEYTYYDKNGDKKTGKKVLKDIEVTAFATLKSTQEEIAFTVTMKQAHAEDWTKNSKYTTLPELMLRYRAATLLIRTHVPEVINGMHMVEEIEDINASKKSIFPPSLAISKLDNFLEKENIQIEVQKEEIVEDLHLKLAKLVEINNVPNEKIQSWCKKAGVDDLVALDIEKTISCIKYIEAQDGINGHSVLK